MHVPMASHSLHFLLLFLFFFSSSITISHSSNQLPQSTFKPNALILPLNRDPATHLYVTRIHKRTPLVPVPFIIHLNGPFLWVDCENQYLSSTYHAPLCHSSQCSIANTHYCRTCQSPNRPGCHNNTCGLVSFNPITRKSGPGELAEDVLSIQSTDGSNPGPLVTVPSFLFACAPSFLLQTSSVPTGVQGIVGLGRTQIALPTQLASHFGFQQKFAICLGGSGSVFFGSGPYMVNPGIDVSRLLTRTPLIINRRGKYFIGVSSIMINNKPVPLNTSLLTINHHGVGGTEISTVVPYTLLETSIYQAVLQSFETATSGFQKVDPVAPFGLCFDSNNITSTRVGPGVPNIDLVLHNNRVVWRIFGSNSMAQVRDGITCLAVVDGGARHKAAIVIGAHQLEDNLLQFDLTTSRLGFSGSLLFRQTTCANFNSTSSKP